MKQLAVLFFLLMSGYAYGQYAVQDSLMDFSDGMPYFPGCEGFIGADKRACSDEKVIGFIKENLRYPQLAMEQGIRGQVIVSFTVNEDGTVTSGKVLREIGAGCGAEGLRVVRNMPKWEPAMVNGEPVKATLSLPIRFNLSEVDLSNTSNYRIAWGELYTDKVNKSDLTKTMSTPMVVRDVMGTEFLIQRLYLEYSNGRKTKTVISIGDINADMKKRLRKAKSGSYLSFKAIIEKEGRLLEIKRVFEVL